MFDFATKHFLMLSSLILVISASFSMVVLSAYLSVFDWNLIWLIEYSDLTKLFLIGAALISSFAMTIIYQTQDVYAWVVKKSAQWKKVVIFGAIFLIILNTVLIYYDIHARNNFEFYYIYRAGSSLLFLLFLYYCFRDLQHLLNGNWIVISNLTAFFTLFLCTTGITYGYYVRDISTVTREIRTKSENFPNAKIIMLLSHHVAFISEKHIIVVPTSDVTRISQYIDVVPSIVH